MATSWAKRAGSRCLRAWLVAWLSLSAAQAAGESRGTGCGPDFKALRYWENYSCLPSAFALQEATEGQQLLPLTPLDLVGFSGPEGWRRLKHIDLGNGPSTTRFLSLGGQFRQRLTFLENVNWGEERENGDWFYTGRIHLHGDLHWDRARLFVELATARDAFGSINNDPVEENALSINQVFAAYQINPSLSVEVGRMEWRYGSQRLIGVRDGTNVRRRFDGARARFAHGDWTIDAFAAAQVELDPGVFDDAIRDDDGLWGLYATGSFAGLPGGIDLYYLGTDLERVSVNQRRGDETRHSLGFRLFGAAEGWDWDLEAVYQLGRVSDDLTGEGRINAWTVASTTGYRFEALPWAPRLALSANIASGDGDPTDADTKGFNALFPRGSYFSEAAILGPRNFYNLHGFVTVNPLEDLSITADLNFYWRHRKRDGIYGPAGNLVRLGGPEDPRFVDTSLSLAAEWEANPFILVSALYTRKWAGAFVRQTGPADDLSFLELTLRFLF